MGMLSPHQRLIPACASAAPASALTYLQRGFAQAAATQADRGGQDFASSPLNVPGGWQQRTQRSGVIAVKVGMTQEWDSWGARIPLTVLWIDNCQARRLALHIPLVYAVGACNSIHRF